MEFKWESTYNKVEANETIKIGEDNSTIRTFMLAEMRLFLELHDFKVLETHDRASYAFPTIVIVAEKV